MTLVEFLKARLDEDEALAQTAGRVTWPSGTMRPDEEDFLNRFHDERVLAEVEAKRRIVKAFESNNNYELYEGCGDDCEWGALDYALKALALPYADHPDYDEMWKP